MCVRGRLILCILKYRLDELCLLCVSFQSVHNCTKEQLIRIAEHYEINVEGKKRKGKIKSLVLTALLERALWVRESLCRMWLLHQACHCPCLGLSLPSGLMFEQQQQLLILQSEQGKIRT